MHTKIQYERYKLRCYIMKKELTILVSYTNVVVNQIDAYTSLYKIHIDEGLCLWQYDSQTNFTNCR